MGYSATVLDTYKVTEGSDCPAQKLLSVLEKQYNDCFGQKSSLELYIEDTSGDYTLFDFARINLREAHLVVLVIRIDDANASENMNRFYREMENVWKKYNPKLVVVRSYSEKVEEYNKEFADLQARRESCNKDERKRLTLAMEKIERMWEQDDLVEDILEQKGIEPVVMSSTESVDKLCEKIISENIFQVNSEKAKCLIQ